MALGATFGSFESVRREVNHIIGNAAPIYDPVTDEVVLLFSRDNIEVWVMISQDRGASWSVPRNISAATVPFAGLGVGCHGSVGGDTDRTRPEGGTTQ